jgi:hypothetical protein
VTQEHLALAPSQCVCLVTLPRRQQAPRLDLSRRDLDEHGHASGGWLWRHVFSTASRIAWTTQVPLLERYQPAASQRRRPWPPRWVRLSGQRVATTKRVISSGAERGCRSGTAAIEDPCHCLSGCGRVQRTD